MESLVLLWYSAVQESVCSFHACPLKKGRKESLLGPRGEE